MIYWDTSAILKLYVRESDSACFLDLIERSQEQISTSVIGTLKVERWNVERAKNVERWNVERCTLKNRSQVKSNL